MCIYTMYMHGLRSLSMSFVVNTPVKANKEMLISLSQAWGVGKNLELPELLELVGVKVKKSNVRLNQSD